MRRKGASPVRRGGVGALGKPRPGLLPDKGHRGLRQQKREVGERPRAKTFALPSAVHCGGQALESGMLGNSPVPFGEGPTEKG
jgi:hypothetical protein